MPNPTFKVLAKQDFSSVTSISFDNVFNLTMKQYKIVVNSSGTSASDFGYRLRVAGVDNTSSVYNSQYSQFSNNSRVAATDQLSFNLMNRNDTDVKNITVFEILNPFQTEYTTSFAMNTAQSVGNIYNSTVGQGIDVNTSYDGVTLYPTGGGNITGSATIYGWVF
jgi:hypothetical protein